MVVIDNSIRANKRQRNVKFFCCILVITLIMMYANIISRLDRFSIATSDYKHNDKSVAVLGDMSFNSSITMESSKASARGFIEPTGTAATSPKYPLVGINLTSATRSYEQGFWQQTPPVPIIRWRAASNTTCIQDPFFVYKATTDTSHSRRDHNFLRRVPFVMILGAQKAGTTALVNYLYAHPHIQRLPTKEMRFFDEWLDQDPTILTGQGIPATQVLQSYQEQVIGRNIPLEVLEFSTHLKVVDGTPNYLWVSDRIPQRVLCAAPWVKLIVLLRNPVDRAFSQYNMQYHRDLNNPSNRRGFVTFEDYVDMDLQVLRDVGVLPNSNSESGTDDGFLNSRTLLEAWGTYTKLGLNSPIGRGLYAIQLIHWLQVLRDTDKDPKTEMLVLQSEQMKNDTKTVYDNVLKFLGLPPYTLPKFGKIHTTTYRVRKMNETTRFRLEAFFRPYNQYLGRLLGEDWYDVWE
jgi:hypothetical protein